MAKGKYNKDGNNIFEKVRKFSPGELTTDFASSLDSLGFSGSGYPKYVAKIGKSGVWANEILDVSYYNDGKSPFASKESTPFPLTKDDGAILSLFDDNLTQCKIIAKSTSGIHVNYDFNENCVTWKYYDGTTHSGKIYANGIYVILVGGGGGGGGGDNEYWLQGKPGGGGGGGGATGLVYLDVKSTISRLRNKYPQSTRLELDLYAGLGGEAGNYGAGFSNGADGMLSGIFIRNNYSGLCYYSVEGGYGGKGHSWSEGADSAGGKGGTKTEFSTNFPDIDCFVCEHLSKLSGGQGGKGRRGKDGDAGQSVDVFYGAYLKFLYADRKIRCDKNFNFGGIQYYQSRGIAANGFGGGGGASAMSVTSYSREEPGSAGCGCGGKGSQSADSDKRPTAGQSGAVYIVDLKPY